MSEVLKRLKEGNLRFVKRVNNPSEFKACQISVGNSPQKPIATVLGCADSRVPIVTLFDQGVGDLFISRVVGNVAVDSVISTIEYGVDSLKTSLIVVLGHTNCGAVNCVASEDKVPPYLAKSLAQIVELKKSILQEHPEFCSKEMEQILLEENIRFSIDKIVNSSDIVRRLVDNGDVTIVGAIYQVETGSIKWLES